MAAAAATNESKFEPSSDLIQEEECDTLLLYLPGFTKEQLRVQLSKSGILRISGRRPLDGDRWSSFQKEFTVSSNCDTTKITAKFEGGILYVRQPKLIIPAASADHDKQDQKPTTPPPPPQSTAAPPPPPPAQEEEKAANGDRPAEKKDQQDETKPTVEGEIKRDDHRTAKGEIKRDDHRMAKGDGIKSDDFVATKLDEYHRVKKLRVARQVTMVVAVVLVAVAVGLYVRRFLVPGLKEA